MSFIKKFQSESIYSILSTNEPLYDASEGIDLYQNDCIKRLTASIQLEQEHYLSEHPEIDAMLKLYLVEILKCKRKKDILKSTALHFTRPFEQLDAEVRELLNVPPDGPYKMGAKKRGYGDPGLINDIMDIREKHFKEYIFNVSPDKSMSTTESSSFISIVTSPSTSFESTVSTPPHSPTISDIFYNMVEKVVEKAVMMHVRDEDLLYDAAYVEVINAVESAMEITVVHIRKDIAALISKAFHMLEIHIQEMDRIEAEIAWENRMRKKLKKTLRLGQNFKGHATPSTSKSKISSQDNKIPPVRPCKCFPTSHFNRYPKDRFGIYLPRETTFCDNNITTTPTISAENLIQPTVKTSVITSTTSKTSQTGIKKPEAKKTQNVSSKNAVVQWLNDNEDIIHKNAVKNKSAMSTQRIEIDKIISGQSAPQQVDESNKKSVMLNILTFPKNTKNKGQGPGFAGRDVKEEETIKKSNLTVQRRCAVSTQGEKMVK